MQSVLYVVLYTEKIDSKCLNYEYRITNQSTVGLFVTLKCHFSTKTLQNPTSMPEPDREKICVSVRFVFESNCRQCAAWEKMHSVNCNSEASRI